MCVVNGGTICFADWHCVVRADWELTAILHTSLGMHAEKPLVLVCPASSPEIRRSSGLASNQQGLERVGLERVAQCCVCRSECVVL